MKTKSFKTFSYISSAAVILLLLSACSGGGGGAGTTTADGATGASSPTTGASSSSSGGPTTPGGGISTVSNGIPSQKNISLSVDKYNLDWSLDGDKAKVTVRVADTAGNPVPDGTTVQFSVGGGRIQTSCQLTGVSKGTSKISECSVEFKTQNRRPSTGYVQVIAWLEGEEAYVDLNGNGQYDASEPFADSGRIFRDDNHNKTYDLGVDELSISSTLTSQPGIGTAACANPDARLTEAAGIEQPYSVQNSCDGVWGKTLIRATAPMAQSNSATIDIQASSVPGVWLIGSYAQPSQVFVGAPGGAKLSLKTPAGCEGRLSRDTVGSTDIYPFSVGIGLSVTTAGATCAGTELIVDVASKKYSRFIS